MKKLLTGTFIAYLLSNFLMLLNKGVFWDDWTVYNMSFEGLKEQWLNNTMVFPMYIYQFLNSLPNPVFWFHLVSFIIGFIIIVQFIKVLQLVNVFSEEQILAIGLILAVTPFYHTRILLISIQYSVCLLSFIIGTRFLITYFENKNYLHRIIAFILFFFSFIISSLVVFYGAVLLLLFTKKYIKNIKGVLTHIDLFILPCLFWIFKLAFLKPGGLHAAEGYNAITLAGLIHSPAGIFASVKSSFFMLFVMMSETLTSNFSAFVIILVILFAIAYSRTFTATNPLEYNAAYHLGKVKLNRLHIFLIAGGLLFILGSFAYVTVGKVPLFDNFNARNQLLLPFGAAILLMSLTELFTRSQYKNIVYAFIIASCIIINVQKMFDYQKDYFRQAAIMENLKTTNLDSSYTIMVIDSSSKYIETETSQVVYTGMVKMVTGNQKHLAISKAKADEMIKRYKSLSILLSAAESLNLKDWKASDFDSKLLIKDGSLDLTSLSTTLKLTYYSWLKPDAFRQTVKSAIVLNLEPIAE